MPQPATKLPEPQVLTDKDAERLQRLWDELREAERDEAQQQAQMNQEQSNQRLQAESQPQRRPLFGLD